MPGLVIDPHQNQETENRFGVAHVQKKLAVYDKDRFPEMRYKPAGWMMENNNIELKPLEKPFDWRGAVQIEFEIIPKNNKSIEKPLGSQGKMVKKLFDDAGGTAGIKQKMIDAGIIEYKPHPKNK